MTRLGDHQLYMDIFVNELQTVPVTGNSHTFPIVIGANSAHGADHIVRFPALAGVDRDIHSSQDFLHHRHLHRQFLRHTMAGSLVAVILQMSEGGAMEVKGNANRIRLFFLFHALQNIEEAVNGMGIKPLTIGKGLHTKIGTIYDGVTV